MQGRDKSAAESLDDAWHGKNDRVMEVQMHQRCADVEYIEMIGAEIASSLT